jgi:hypothetical protein
MGLIRSALLLCLLLGLSTVRVFASAPSIIVNGDPPLNFTIITTDQFGFGTDASGGGDFGFTNATGQVWTRLDILVTLPTFQTITCGSVAFVTCTVTTTTQPGASPASYDIIFGPNPIGGIANAQNFTIDLNDNGIVNTDPDGSGSWGPDTDFTAKVTTAAPEPASVALGGLGLLTCVGLALARRGARTKALL